MGKCKRKEPYSDFLFHAEANELGTWESKSYIYTPDGLYRIKKSHTNTDKARCKLDVLLEIRQQTLGY